MTCNYGYDSYCFMSGEEFLSSSPAISFTRAQLRSVVIDPV
jgi:hypothetical protein